jgi:hypothetical protein
MTSSQLPKEKSIPLLPSLRIATTPSDASTLTQSVCTPRPPSVLPNTNSGIEALILRKGAIGSTKPVSINATNILTWFRDNANAPSTGSSESIRRGARHLFQPVSYTTTDESTTTNKRSASASVSSSNSNFMEPSQTHFPVGGISPLRRLLLEDISLLPANTGIVCVLCVGSGHESFPFYHALTDTINETERLPTMQQANKYNFVQLKVSIISNLHRSNLEIGPVVSRSLFTHLVVGNGNAFIGIQFIGTKDGSHHTAFLLLKDFFIHHENFQLWACLSYRRNFRDAFKSKTSKDSRLHLLRRLALEVHGDVAQTLDLCAAFDASAPKQTTPQRQSEALALAIESCQLETLKALPIGLFNDNVKNLSDYANQLIGERVKELT